MIMFFVVKRMIAKIYFSEDREIGLMIQDEKIVNFTERFEITRGLLIHYFDHFL